MKSFRTQIVMTTVLLVAAVMLAVVIGTQLVLEAGEGHPQTHSASDVLVATGLVGGIGVALSGVVAWVVSRRVLRPVRQMAERADEWSATDLERRFDLGAPTTELSRLGRTLDSLLDRVARTIRDEQRLTSELAHEIRTPLTAILGSAELAALRPPGDPALPEDIDEIGAAARRLSEVVTSLLDLSQRVGAATGDTVTLDEVAPMLQHLVGRGVALDVGSSGLRMHGSADLVARALSPLVENAAQHARSRVTLVARADDRLVAIAVTDDGAGIEPELRDSVFEAGVSSRGSSGLGLGIARRVARSLGGEVELVGEAFVLRVPRAT